MLYDPITVTEHWTASNRGPLGKSVHTLLQALVSDQVGPAEHYDTHAPLQVTLEVVMTIKPSHISHIELGSFPGSQCSSQCGASN